jgi:hypothetical protein
MDLKKIIKKNIQGFKLKKSCSCGCNTCEDKRSLAPILNESIAPREILSEGLKHHITRNKPLTENVYRAGSENYFNLWAEARSLYSRGILEIQNSDDLEILTETNLGEFGILEDGTKVPLDFPIEEEIEKNKQYYKNIASLDKKGLAKKQFSDEDIQIAKKMLSRGEFNLDESKNENKPIGKPMRDSSGGKAYKVYVKDPKTKKIKTVRFGSGGLKAKINNPKARQAFAKRHDCKNKKDRTKASYWSCRLPRYASLLGLKSSFSGFW